LLVVGAAISLIALDVNPLTASIAGALQVDTTVSLGGSGTVSDDVPVYLAAQIGPNQTMPGAVSFTDNASVIPGCSDVAVQPGATSYESAFCMVTYASPGTHTIVATFTSSDPSNSSAVSPPQVLTVLSASTMTISSAPSKIIYGQPYTLHATVTGPAGSPTPTGTVDFFGGSAAGVGGCTVTLVGGTGSCTTPDAATSGTEPVGTNIPIVANYSGDAAYAGSSGGGAVQAPATITIVPATTVIQLTTSANPAYASEPPVFTVTISDADQGSGLPYGTVTFSVNGNTACEPESDEGTETTVTCQAPALDPYTFNGTVLATFTGSPEGDYANATSNSITQVVQPVPTDVTATATPDPSPSGTLEALTATVTGASGTPEGQVVFTDGSTNLCTADVPSAGNCLTKALPEGQDTITATYTDTVGDVAAGSGTDLPAVYSPSSTTFTSTVPASTGHGYWLVGGDGGIFNFGDAPFHGSTGSLQLQRPIVGITATSDDNGYWLVGSDGGIFAFGDTHYFGSMPALGFAPAGTNGAKHLSAPIVAMVPSFDDQGYFLVGADGGVFAFGDAKFAGSCPQIGSCSGVAVSVMPDASGQGYWLVTKTGNVYSFGNAIDYGAPGQQSAPVTSAVRTPDGGGYWILLGDGAVLAYGDARTYPGTAGTFNALNPATAIVATSDGGGYWVMSANGSVYPFGDAPNDGGMSGQHLNAPIITAAGF
jgi:hypothetical protein